MPGSAATQSCDGATAYIEQEAPGGVPVKMWTRGVPVEDDLVEVVHTLKQVVCVKG